MNKAKSLVSITDFDVEEYLKILELAAKFEANSYRNVLNGRVIASLFFEPSTRTRLSFESAINRLGGRVIGFSDIETTSSTKGETLHDTIKIISNYCDLIVMRHPLEGAAKSQAKSQTCQSSMRATEQTSTPRKHCSTCIPSQKRRER